MELDPTRSRKIGDAPAGEDGRRVCLLVFEGDSSRAVPLPSDGEVLIGRALECQVRLADSGVSRKHACLKVREGQPWLSDLDSHNGTRVNGQRIGSNVELKPGDALTVGDCTLILHGASRPPQPTPIQSMKIFRERLDAEVERGLRYEHCFCLARLRFSQRPAGAAQIEKALSATVRLMDVCAWDADDLLILLPELEPRDASAAVEDLVEALAFADERLRAGYAMFPYDGAAADPLLLSARQAVEAAKTGALESADQCVQELQLGARRTVLVADPSMARVYDQLRRLGTTALPVLIIGETGVGKENAAYAVHHFSPRAGKPFVSLNCAALPDTLLESELFGYEKGAFSGAYMPKPGLFEAAHEGTIFLDEVGELSAAAQARLLRVLETGTLLRLGSIKEREIDIRVVAATLRDLPDDVKAGKFREDLFYRLGAATVTLPPLRARRREIALLARRFLEKAARGAGREPPLLSARTMAALADYSWPGNVRELKNAMEYAAALACEAVLEPWHLPERLVSAQGLAGPPPPGFQPSERNERPSGFRPLAEEIRELEQRRIREALQAAGGVQTRAAELIGMPRRTFVLRLRELRMAGVESGGGDPEQSGGPLASAPPRDER